MQLTLDRVLYTDEELRGMLGFTKKKLRVMRQKGVIEFCPSKPIRYTRRMIEDFISRVEKNPSIILS